MALEKEHPVTSNREATHGVLRLATFSASVYALRTVSFTEIVKQSTVNNF